MSCTMPRELSCSLVHYSANGHTSVWRSPESSSSSSSFAQCFFFFFCIPNFSFVSLPKFLLFSLAKLSLPLPYLNVHHFSLLFFFFPHLNVYSLLPRSHSSVYYFFSMLWSCSHLSDTLRETHVLACYLFLYTEESMLWAEEETNVRYWTQAVLFLLNFISCFSLPSIRYICLCL